MNGVPRIESVKPAAALPGGEVALIGSGFGGLNAVARLARAT